MSETSSTSGQGQTTLVPRRRAGGKRSVTGCRTCRVRHKKCDEAPGACNNCTSTGRRCDGYDQHRLPRASKTNTPPQAKFQIVPGLVGGVHRTMNREERRCFSFFHLRTMPAMVGFFDSALWQQLILQMGHEEPAVYHAIVALSAFHQDSERQGMPLSKEDLGNTWHRFALEQSMRSFSLLHTRRASHDPRLREVTLLCCLVFVLLEWLRGQYDKAFGHLRSGIQMLKEFGVKMTDESRVRGPPVERALVAAFAHLDIQSAQFGETSSLVGGSPILEITTSQADRTPAFRNISDAREALDHILERVFKFTNSTEALSHEQLAMQYESLYQEQSRRCAEVSEFARTFDHFRATRYYKLSAKEQRGADVIHLHQTAASLHLEICLLESNDPLLNTYTPRFERLLACVGEVTDKFPERPSVCMDMGIIPPLFLVATGCRDYRVRERAIEALRAWPHREGPWDSNLGARIATEIMKIESVAGSAPPSGDTEGFTSEPANNTPAPRGVSVTISEDQIHACLSYHMGNEQNERWFKLDGK
ncbi:Zn(II)2Cys6 transcription factor [Aspergillus fijiensis CBS 313.89]|uniref:C6 zinc finger domain protein n=1 Tax=Aspergillus fijiensis CBS 313.89 TaxID=1448319 RepID=A0A8G1VTG1_9EURO|nr:C6 zinc finger domain protein [Aspergillus fijiensis CBS 313.89]RAK72285.1 C6 zinc finger domain protein [Aspergillus fijiensis CBS 313.89]